ncbi:MAG: Tsukamurella phage [Bacteroidota bacterium]|jgi:hypothetical protein
MANLITTIFEKLKITAPSRNEKVDYFLMLDKDDEVCAVPLPSILAKVNNRIDGIVYPDGFTKTGIIQRVGNEITIAANEFKWRIQLNPYANVGAFNTTIAATTTPDLNRIDSLAASSENTIVLFSGEEVDETSVAIPPVMPTGYLRLTDIYVLGTDITETTEPIVTEIYTLAEKEKLGILDSTSDIDKPVSTLQAAADADVLQDAKDYADTGLALKLDTADYNDRYKGKYTSFGALTTAHPTANSGDYAQVDAGSGSDVVNYNYDVEEGWIEGGSGSGATDTDALPEGSSNLYFTAARVLATVLTGISFVTGGAIVSTDSVLVAFGKIQKQLTDGFTTANIKSILGITVLSGDNTGDQDLSNLVVKNTAITGATKTKVTYDSKGLVTAGADATTADVADSANKRYVSDAQQTVLGNTSGTNTGDETTTTLGALIGGAADATPNDSDYVATALTSGGVLKKITWTNVKAFLKLYFDGLYENITPNVQSVSSSATVTPVSTNDEVIITAQAANLTLGNPTGTFAEGQALIVRIKDNGTSRTITFGSNYRAIGVTLPTATTVSKTMYLAIIYNNTDSKWDVVGTRLEA